MTATDAHAQPVSEATYLRTIRGAEPEKVSWQENSFFWGAMAVFALLVLIYLIHLIRQKGGLRKK